MMRDGRAQGRGVMVGMTGAMGKLGNGFRSLPCALRELRSGSVVMSTVSRGGATRERSLGQWHSEFAARAREHGWGARLGLRQR